ncbi:NUDIX hydrolase [Parahaliea mediterranea]|uniref:NUDIX hydrolase n=1 Tax=Parahaliea mediterranea TaxID=651086 RepID=A0A939IL93_9GAMM|nr:NUDIX hydrolase [Parahaliea mediterranea]MBN7798151.1 NUDIX hydrolase [Parahaliea mediterranea]
MDKAVLARPASTVVLLRDGARGLETLLLKRNKALMFAGGVWVFPGGAIEAADRTAAADDPDRAARLAAVREAREECGLAPLPERMQLISRWITPEVEPKRFDTRFYAAPVDGAGDVVIDGSEIHDARWLPVREAVEFQEQGELGLLPPTFITLCDLARFDSLASFLARGERAAPPQVMPVIGKEDGQLLVMFPGDAGYDRGDATTPGPRHRAVLCEGRWHYRYQGVDAAWPSLVHG